MAVAARIEKTVKLSVKVNPNGSVADIKVVDGHPVLNSVALEAVRQWKFTTTPVGGTTDVEIVFKPPVAFNGSVSGKVVDPDGKPLADVRVTARRINYRHGRPSWVASAAAATTDADGAYNVQVREAGEYYIVASHTVPNGAPANVANSLSPYTFYPGTPDRLAAVPVIVREGPSMIADIRVPRIATVSLCGKIVVPPLPAPPREPLTLRLMRIESQFADESVAGLNAALEDRTEIPFDLRGVRPGRYRIEVAVETGPPNWAYSGSLLIDAGDRDLEDLTVLLHRNVEFKGRIIWPDPATRLNELRISLSGRSSGSGALFRPEADGTVRLFNLPEDDYNVTVGGLPGNAYVSDLRIGPRSIFVDGVIQVADRPPEDLQILVSSGGGSISGTAQTAIKQGAESFLFLVPDGARRGNPLFYKAARSDSAGAFQISGIAPGDYTLFAFESRPPEGAMENSEFIAPYVQRGVRLTLREGNLSPGVTVQIIPKF